MKGPKRSKKILSPGSYWESCSELVNKILPKESLLEEARKFAQKGGIALRLAMEAVHHGLDLPLEKGCKLEASLAGLSWATEDAKEGTEAFLEKRKPIFKDR
jgi:enoyl-CoA hydratase/carnithine racemase